MARVELEGPSEAVSPVKKLDKSFLWANMKEEAEKILTTKGGSYVPDFGYHDVGLSFDADRQSHLGRFLLDAVSITNKNQLASSELEKLKERKFVLLNLVQEEPKYK